MEQDATACRALLLSKCIRVHAPSHGKCNEFIFAFPFYGLVARRATGRAQPLGRTCCSHTYTILVRHRMCHVHFSTSASTRHVHTSSAMRVYIFLQPKTINAECPWAVSGISFNLPLPLARLSLVASGTIKLEYTTASGGKTPSA